MRMLSLHHLCLALLAALALSSSGCVFANIDLSSGVKPYTESTIKGSGGPKVALIDVSGVITGHVDTPFLGLGGPQESMLKRVVDQIELAGKDEDVVAIVLKIDSPGGGVTASDLIHRAVLKAREGGKKVVAVLMDTAASGGYYVAVGCDKIVAHPTTVTGSIGVILQTFDLSGLMKKVGVKVAPVKSGANKDIGSPFREMKPAERKLLQELVDDMQARFVSRVRAGRPEIPAERLTKLADGRVFTANQALKNGLIDQIGYLEDGLKIARELGGATEARVIRYHRENEPAGNLNAAALLQAGVHIGWAQSLGPLQPGLYYYWAPGR